MATHPYQLHTGRCAYFDFNIGEHKLPFLVGIGITTEILQQLNNISTDHFFIITDKTFAECNHEYICSLTQNLHLPCDVLTIDAREKNKSIEQVAAICSSLLNKGCTRESVIIALGGGVTGNITGLVASLLYRGIAFIHIPTTLLAMHDSVTSCKQAINQNRFKNILGTYYKPEMVFVEVELLKTLPERHLASGKAELVKNALIFGGQEYDLVESLITKHSAGALFEMILCGIKAKDRLLQKDPYEKKEAIIFEYGHTIGHALETYFGGRMPHGEAVAWGMHLAANISTSLGILPVSQLEMHQSLIDKLGFEFPEDEINIDEIIKLVLKDNKRGYIRCENDYVPMLLLEKIGCIKKGNKSHPMLWEVPVHAVRENLLEFIKNNETVKCK